MSSFLFFFKIIWGIWNALWESVFQDNLCLCFFHKKRKVLFLFEQGRHLASQAPDALNVGSSSSPQDTFIGVKPQQSVKFSVFRSPPFRLFVPAHLVL